LERDRQKEIDERRLAIARAEADKARAEADKAKALADLEASKARNAAQSPVVAAQPISGNKTSAEVAAVTTTSPANTPSNPTDWNIGHYLLALVACGLGAILYSYRQQSLDAAANATSGTKNILSIAKGVPTAFKRYVVILKHKIVRLLQASEEGRTVAGIAAILLPVAILFLWIYGNQINKREEAADASAANPSKQILSLADGSAESGNKQSDLVIFDQLLTCSLSIIKVAAYNAKSDGNNDNLILGASLLSVPLAKTAEEFSNQKNIDFKKRGDAIAAELGKEGPEAFYKQLPERMTKCSSLLKNDGALNEMNQRHTAEFQKNLAADDTKSANELRFAATLSCGRNGRHINILLCLMGEDRGPTTEFELTNGGSYRMYQFSDIRALGQERSDGVKFGLKTDFAIKVQNASRNFILTLKIIDPKNGKTVFEKSAAHFGVISVTNK